MKQNGENENSYQKSSRKRWSVQDEPHSLLRRLRSQLAEDGCAESQLMMAKTLLELTEGNILENQQQAIYWLIQSSLQGNAKATEELEKSLESGIGICEKNFEDVKICLDMDLQGKLAAVAARGIFERLSEGNGFICEKRLVAEICSNEKDLSLSTKSLEDKFGGQRIDEKCLLNAAKEYTEGKLPSLIPYQKLLTPGDSIMLLTTYIFMLQALLTVFNRLHSVRTVIYVSLIAVFLSPVSALTVEEIKFCLVYLVHISAFSLGLNSIASILVLIEHYKLFCLWGQLFHRSCIQIDCSAANKNFNSKYLPLSVTCLFSIVITALFHVALSKMIIIFFLFPFLYVCLLSATLLLRTSKYHALSLFLFVLTINPHYLAFNYARVFDLSMYLGDVQGVEGIGVELTSKIPLQLICFASLLFVYWKSGFLPVALQFLLIGGLKVVENLLMVVYSDKIFIASCLLWVIILFPGILKHLFRFVSGFLIFLTLLHNDYGNAACYTISISVVTMNYVLVSVAPKFGYLYNAVAILLPISIFISDSDVMGISNLDWESYQNACLPRREGLITMVYDCSSLTGTVVQWEGIVKSVDITSITNRVESVVLLFPLIIQRPMRCFVGCRESCFGSSDTTEPNQRPLFLYSEGCSTHEFNSYTYDIAVIMERPFWKLGSSEISLRADTKFKEIAALLESGDSIRFTGILASGIGTDLPVIKPFEISCKNCKSQHAINNLPESEYIHIFNEFTKYYNKALLEHLQSFHAFILHNLHILRSKIAYYQVYNNTNKNAL